MRASLPAVRSRRRLAPTLLFAAAAALLPLAAGCQQEAAPSPGAPVGAASPGAGTTDASYPVPRAPEGTMKVGLITPGSVATDKAWSGLAYEGVKRIEKELGAEVTPPVEGPEPAAVAGAARTLAQGGNHLIFLHGSEYDDAAAEVAPDFQKTTFVVIGGRTEKPNLTPIEFRSGEATYLAGMLAAGMSKSGKIACVGAAEIPIVRDSFQSFAKGAKAVKPGVDVRIVFTGDEKDVSKAKQQTQALLSEGVDVVMHNANEGGKGVAQAVTEKPGVAFIGANSDQSDLATPQNLGSFILDVPNAYLAAGKVVKEGKGTGKKVAAGLADRAVYFKYNPGFAGTIPADLKAKIAQAEKDIAAGKVDTAPDSAAGS